MGANLNFCEFNFGYNLVAQTTLILELGFTIQINTTLKIHDEANH